MVFPDFAMDVSGNIKAQKRRPQAPFKVMINFMPAETGRYHPINNKENQFIDFRLLTTKKEKPRFFLLCQQLEGALRRLSK
ncbi:MULTISPECIES: hypothetical protein [Enterobacterales]|uniref:hypothetical protein n=1 Tax=Enterobacterales TaxID=91347 RepID=UPI002ED7D7E5